MGLGLASWRDGLEVSGTMSTGYINPDFASVTPYPGQPGIVHASIVGDGKVLAIFIEDAQPGDIYQFEYTVTTKGSIPVKFDLDVASSDPSLTVVNTLPRNVLQFGEIVTGDLSIEVGGNVEELTDYGFHIDLYFSQWNMVD